MWEWFLEIHNTARFSFTEMKAWAELNQVQLSVLETRTIVHLNQIYRDVTNG